MALGGLVFGGPGWVIVSANREPRALFHNPSARPTRPYRRSIDDPGRSGDKVTLTTRPRLGTRLRVILRRHAMPWNRRRATERTEL